CDACAKRIGEAEALALLMIEADQQISVQLPRPKSATIIPLRARRFSLREFSLATAAALIIGILPTSYFGMKMTHMSAAMQAQNQLVARLASNQYRRVAFAGDANSPAGHVMYANDGSWYYVVVDEASRPLRVAWQHNGVDHILGNVAPSGNRAVLYLAQSTKMDSLALMDGNTIVASAKLAF
ncbi:MAG: hypothetical protein ACYDA1_09235, partial [Vulcanimicrobiaceae bacterium]